MMAARPQDVHVHLVVTIGDLRAEADMGVVLTGTVAQALTSVEVELFGSD